MFSLITLVFLVPLSFAVFPQDEIKFQDLGESFYLKNETYVFQLLQGPLVPLNIINHVIYTGSTAQITTLTKRTLFEKRHQLLEFSEEHHDHLARLLYENDVGRVPSYLKRNQMKRSVGTSSDGVMVIPLTEEGYSLLLYDPEELRGQRKRHAQQNSIFGTTFCVHLFFTMCSDDDSTTEIKNALNGATTEMWAELDSCKTTNDQRAISLANTLESKKNILNGLIALFTADDSTSVSELISQAAQQESINAVNMAYGDQVVQAQIDYLKRTVNSLLRYTKALAGTDPRQVMAQPSLTDLFTGYLSVINYLTINPGGFIPIIENRTFNWTEIPLPQDVVSNTATPPDSYVLWDTSQFGTTLSYPGIQVTLQLTCSIQQVSSSCATNINDCTCQTQSSFPFVNLYGFFYGPIPMNMVGIYDVLYNGNPKYPSINTVSSVYNGNTPLILSNWTRPNTVPLVWYCVQFGPYKGLSTFTSTPFMMNGIPLDSEPLNISECNDMMLRSTPQSVTNTIYSMYVINENVLIPFFSNCTAERLITGNFTTGIQTLGYLSQYPNGYSFSQSSTTYPNPVNLDYRANTDVFEYHMISSDCSINLEPEWIGMEYWFSTQDTVISNIPTGFKLNQFTINPTGELSSSLEFVYTESWVSTYYIQRISENRIITDEIDLLDGDQLLFLINSNGTFVIDESNSFYGQGNNGRDCIQKAETYLYDLTSCIFQNDLVDYDANNYFKGLVQTSGIARYVNKFDFSVSENPGVGNTYTFSLIPDDDADFNFYFQPDGTICPRLVTSNSDVSGCTFSFWFNGTGTPQFNDLPLHFVKNQVTTTTGFGLFSLTIGNPPQDCMLVYCQFSAKYSTINLEPPPYTIISASDLALQSQVNFAIDENMNGTLSNLKDVSLKANALVPQFKNFSKKLSEINFNVSVLYPYQDFTKQREAVTAMINNLTDEQSQSSWAISSISCGDIFSGVECFFMNIGGMIITGLIIVGVIVGIYCVCFKFGLSKVIMKCLFG